MASGIIVGYDATEGARDALALGRTLASVDGAPLLLAWVCHHDPARGHGGRHGERALAEAEEGLAAIAAELPSGAGVSTVPSGSPGRGLHDLAEADSAGLLVLGSSTEAPDGQTLAGSVAERLLHGAPCAVALAPRGYAARQDTRLQVVAAAYDGSPESEAALRGAAQIAVATGATMRVVAVAEPSWHSTAVFASGRGEAEIPPHVRDWLRRHLDEALHGTPDGLEVEAEVATGHAADVLRQRAEAGIDLLALGSRGYGPLRRVLLGSVSASLLRGAPCPVLVFPRG